MNSTSAHAATATATATAHNTRLNGFTRIGTWSLDMAPRWLGMFQGSIAVTCDVTIWSIKHDIDQQVLTAGHYAQRSAEEQSNAILLAFLLPAAMRVEMEIQGLRFVPAFGHGRWYLTRNRWVRESRAGSGTGTGGRAANTEFAATPVVQHRYLQQMQI